MDSFSTLERGHAALQPFARVLERVWGLAEDWDGEAMQMSKMSKGLERPHTSNTQNNGQNKRLKRPNEFSLIEPPFILNNTQPMPRKTGGLAGWSACCYVCVLG